jgi:hypothetical protein
MSRRNEPLRDHQLRKLALAIANSTAKVPPGALIRDLCGAELGASIHYLVDAKLRRIFKSINGAKK